jgi:hypothetical protein
MNDKTSKELMGLVLRALHRDEDLSAYVKNLSGQGILPVMNINIGFTVHPPEQVTPDPDFDRKFLKGLRITD